MGLDMYLFKRKKNNKISDNDEELVYWRKANQIRSWIVRNTDYNDDWDCEPFDLSKQTLEALYADCELVLNNHNKAQEIMPTSNGFFFGSDAYNEWYFENIKYTRDMIKHILETTDFEADTVYYYEWW